MRKASPSILNNATIYAGLSSAFSGSNIGMYSNDISKIWNSDVFISGTDEEKKEAMDVIKLLCMENNFKIDYAKTLYMPERPSHVKERILRYTNVNVPYFFKYAKDKEDHQVSEINGSLVNKLNFVIVNPRINCRKLGLEKINYALLMHNPDIECKVSFTDKGKVIKEQTDPIILKYIELNKKYGYAMEDAKKVDEVLSGEMLSNSQLKQTLRYKEIVSNTKSELSKFGYSDTEIADILVKFLYGIKDSKHKMLLWLCYGDIIYNTLNDRMKLNVKDIECVDCGKWFQICNKDNRTCRCADCLLEYKRNASRIRTQKFRAKQM